MKKLSYFMAAAMMLAVGCQKEDIKNNEVIENTGYTRTLTVGVADEADTRVGFDENNAFYWHEGDKIGVQTAEGFKEMTLLEDYGHKASGVFGGNFEDEMEGYVVYPYNSGHRVEGEKLTYVLPTSYEYESISDDANSFNPPMLGMIDGGNAKLNHLASFFKIIVENLPVGEEMTFTFTADKRITGEFVVDFKGEYPEINTDDADGKTVTITFSNTEAGADGYFYIPAPLGTYGSITVDVKNGEETLVTKTWQNQTVRRKTPKRGTIPVGFVAEINGKRYETLQDAIDEVEDGGTIMLKADVNQNEGVQITDKNITIDLNGKTFTVSEGTNTNNRNFKIDGTSVVTIKNGTMVAGGDYSSGAYGTVRTEGTANVTLEKVKLYNYRGNGLNVKACTGTNVTITNSEVYSRYGGGIEAAGGTITLENVKVEQEGMYVAPYNSMAISVNGGGEVTVVSGTYSTKCLTAEEANGQGTSHGPWVVGVCNSGGTLIINGGTFSNDNFGENSFAANARGCVFADTGADVQINGGTFNALKSIIDYQNNLGDASKNPVVTIKGGTFSADPTAWLADGYTVYEEDGLYKAFSPVEDGISDAAQMFAFAKMVNSGNSFSGKTVELKADINLENEEWTPIGTEINSFEGNFDGQNKVIKNLKITAHISITDSWGVWAYAGLFGVTSGSETQYNSIKNFVIENVTIDCEGDIVAAAVAYPYYTDIEHIAVKGDISIKGKDYTAGVLGYTRRCVNAKDLQVVGNSGSTITGNSTVGGVISDIQMNGGLTADYSNFKASGLIITGDQCVGGVSGIISSQTLDGATVENVEIICDDARRGTVSGALGGRSVIRSISVTDVTGATNVVGATYDGANEVVVDGDVYDKAETNN